MAPPTELTLEVGDAAQDGNGLVASLSGEHLAAHHLSEAGGFRVGLFCIPIACEQSLVP